MSTIDPKLIQFDPSIEVVPMMSSVAEVYRDHSKADLRQVGAELSAELSALHGNLDANGILEPIPVTRTKRGGKEVVIGWDGRHRTEWAIQRGLAEVPIKEVDEASGRTLLEATVLGRRHWTKGQRAWLAVLMHSAVCETGKGRPKKSDSVGVSAVSLAERYGVSPDLIGQAVELHRVFAAGGPVLRARYEPGIWAGHGLGAVLAGIPGAQATADKPRKAVSWTTMQGPLATLSRVATLFPSWPEEDKAATRDALQAWLQRVPEDFRLTLHEALTQAEGAAES